MGALFLLIYGLNFRSVFGGTVGPNPVKPQNPNDPQYYDGIKPRAQPLVISIQSNTNTNAQPQPKGVKRKASTGSVSPAVTTTLTVIADNQDVPLASPASPILKAQLSAPPKQREGGAPATPCTKSGDMKSQVSLVELVMIFRFFLSPKCPVL